MAKFKVRHVMTLNWLNIMVFLLHILLAVEACIPLAASAPSLDQRPLISADASSDQPSAKEKNAQTDSVGDQVPPFNSLSAGETNTEKVPDAGKVEPTVGDLNLINIVKKIFQSEDENTGNLVKSNLDPNAAEKDAVFDEEILQIKQETATGSISKKLPDQQENYNDNILIDESIEPTAVKKDYLNDASRDPGGIFKLPLIAPPVEDVQQAWRKLGLKWSKDEANLFIKQEKYPGSHDGNLENSYESHESNHNSDQSKINLVIGGEREKEESHLIGDQINFKTNLKDKAFDLSSTDSIGIIHETDQETGDSEERTEVNAVQGNEKLVNVQFIAQSSKIFADSKQNEKSSKKAEKILQLSSDAQDANTTENNKELPDKVEHYVVGFGSFDEDKETDVVDKDRENISVDVAQSSPTADGGINMEPDSNDTAPGLVAHHSNVLDNGAFRQYQPRSSSSSPPQSADGSKSLHQQHIAGAKYFSFSSLSSAAYNISHEWSQREEESSPLLQNDGDEESSQETDVGSPENVAATSMRGNTGAAVELEAGFTDQKTDKRESTNYESNANNGVKEKLDDVDVSGKSAVHGGDKKSKDMDEREIDDRGSEETSSKNIIKLKYVHIETDLSSKEQEEVPDDVEYLIGNHKRIIKATPTLKSDESTQTQSDVDANEDSSVDSTDNFTPETKVIYSVSDPLTPVDGDPDKESRASSVTEYHDKNVESCQETANNLLHPVESCKEELQDPPIESEDKSLVDPVEGSDTDTTKDSGTKVEEAKTNETLESSNKSETFIEPAIVQVANTTSGKSEGSRDGQQVIASLNATEVIDTNGEKPLQVSTSDESADLPTNKTTEQTVDGKIAANETSAGETQEQDEDGAMEGDHSEESGREEGVANKTEVKETDSIETYSQFAERVAMEKKNDGVSGNGVGGSAGSSSATLKSSKLSPSKKYNKKNYAGTDCGSKLLSANPEAQHASKVIQSNRDEYLLNDCKQKTWFVVELCESIRLSRFEIANFELYSNLPRELLLYGSQRYPTRDWTPLGIYTAQEANRGIQPFDVNTETFFKYVKLEVSSHYGTEYYCPVSLFRIFGVSEFEVIDSMEDGGDDLSEEEEQLMQQEEQKDVKEAKKVRSMLPTVLRSMLTNVLGVLNRGASLSITSKTNQTPAVDECSCLDPRYKIDENKCSLAPTINWHLGCYDAEYKYVMKLPIVAKTVENREFCKSLVDHLCSEKGHKEMREDEVKEGEGNLSGSQVDLDFACSARVCGNNYVCLMLCSHHLLALCHIKHFNLAVNHSNNTSNTTNVVKCASHTTVRSEKISTNSNIVSDIGEKKLVQSYILKGKSEQESADAENDNLSMKNTLDKESTTEAEAEGAKPASGSNAPKDEGSSDINGGNVEQSNGGSKLGDKDIKGGGTETANKERVIKKESSSKDSTGEQKNGNKDKKTAESKRGDGNGKNVNGDGKNGSPLPTMEQDPHSARDNNGGNGHVITAPVNKESVVVRLSNKIKVLEHNQSITSQYLEELSLRFKRHSEDIQQLVSSTLAALNASAPSQVLVETQSRQQDTIATLQQQMQDLHDVVSQLALDNESLATKVIEQHLLLMCAEVVLLLVTFFWCMRRHRHQWRQHVQQQQEQLRVALAAYNSERYESSSPVHVMQGAQPLPLDWRGGEGEYREKEVASSPRMESDKAVSVKFTDGKTPTLTRRLSMDGTKSCDLMAPGNKTRRGSIGEQNIAGTYRGLLKEQASSGRDASTRKRKKKSKIVVKRSNSSLSAYSHNNSKSNSNTDNRIQEMTQLLAPQNESSNLSAHPPTSTSKVEKQSKSQSGGSCLGTFGESPRHDILLSSVSADSGHSQLNGSTLDGNKTVSRCLYTSRSYSSCSSRSRSISSSSSTATETNDFVINIHCQNKEAAIERLALVKQAREKGKIVKETQREVTKKQNLNKSSAGVLFSCERQTDKHVKNSKNKSTLENLGSASTKQKPTTKKSEDYRLPTMKPLSGLVNSSQNAVKSLNNSPIVYNNSFVTNFNKSELNNYIVNMSSDTYLSKQMVFEDSRNLCNKESSDVPTLMRISECSESSSQLNVSSEVLSDNESPIHTDSGHTNSQLCDKDSVFDTNCTSAARYACKTRTLENANNTSKSIGGYCMDRANILPISTCFTNDSSGASEVNGISVAVSDTRNTIDSVSTCTSVHSNNNSFSFNDKVDPTSRRRSYGSTVVSSSNHPLFNGNQFPQLGSAHNRVHSSTLCTVLQPEDSVPSDAGTKGHNGMGSCWQRQHRGGHKRAGSDGSISYSKNNVPLVNSNHREIKATNNKRNKKSKKQLFHFYSSYGILSDAVSIATDDRDGSMKDGGYYKGNSNNAGGTTCRNISSSWNKFGVGFNAWSAGAKGVVSNRNKDSSVAVGGSNRQAAPGRGSGNS